MASKVYPGDIFKCNETGLEVRVLKAAKDKDVEITLTCNGKEMENAGGLNPANSW